ncbi:MAG TPA: protein kinase, partial [Acidimicrobiales bacterium]|nr:protein kinase [Acidimicrobiales bacterium]
MEKLADRYELGDALGQGRSTVFRAVDSRLRRDVAIKRVQLLAGQEDAQQVRTRALREAQASARLNNPAVVTVYDVVEEDGAIWLVMELVAGPSLSQIVSDEGPLPAPRAAAIGLGVLTALEAAHLVGVVHRDVKPANVLVTEGDRAKLTDFGVATIRDESRVTATGLIVGSPSYMAPEQATGGEITASTDLWALGAMLYFSVEGTPPFQAGSALATASAVVHGEPRPQQNRGQLTPVIDRLLVKDPAARARAGEIRAALTRIARDERRRRRPRRDPSAGATQLMPVTPQAFKPAGSSTPSPPAAAVPPPAAAPPPEPAPTPPDRAPEPAPTPEAEPSALEPDPAPESSASEMEPGSEPGSSAPAPGLAAEPQPEPSVPAPEPAPTVAESPTGPVTAAKPELDPGAEPEPSAPEPDPT